MIKHIVMWKLDNVFNEAEKKEIKQTFKSNLEGLHTIVAGIVKVNVEIEPLKSSNVDLILISEFNDYDALNAYQAHPKHQEVASYLKGKVISRHCMDYEC